MKHLKTFESYGGQNYINSIEDLKQQINHPYRSGEYFFDESGSNGGSQIYAVLDSDEENEEFINSFDEDSLEYKINWEDNSLFTVDGIKIDPVYDVDDEDE